MGNIIYMDNANVSRVSEGVIEAMLTRYRENFGVPGGEFGHRYEEEAAEALWKARETVARKINARPEEIIFTSGVTESNNLAIKGALRYMEKVHGNLKILTSKIERKCVMRSFEHLQKRGHEAVFLPVDRGGFLDMDALQKEAGGASFISIQHANQEIGTVQDIRAIGDIAEDRGLIFHSDATHSFLKEPIDVEKLKVDMMSFSGHVIHAPLGSGALFVREGVKLEPLFHGDSREFGLRAGHPNVPAIVGFARAIEEMGDEDVRRMRGIRDFLIDSLLEIPDTKLNGPRDRRVCDNINVSFKGVEGEAILMLASAQGLILRTGSACFSPQLKSSYVIAAIGGSAEDANSSTRLSLGRDNTMEEAERAVEILSNIIDRLRKISPIYRKVRK